MSARVSRDIGGVSAKVSRNIGGVSARVFRNIGGVSAAVSRIIGGSICLGALSARGSTKKITFLRLIQRRGF